MMPYVRPQTEEIYPVQGKISKNIYHYFFPSGHGNESYKLIGSLTTVTMTLAWVFSVSLLFSILFKIAAIVGREAALARCNMITF